MMADKFNYLRPEIKNDKAEADVDLIPIPGQLERITWQMQMWCLAVYMLLCSLLVADLIVGMEELELHYRCRGRSNFANPPTSYRSLSGPPGPKSPKSLKKSLPGPPALGSQKVWKKSRKSPEQTFSRLFGLFRDFFQTFGDPRAGGPGRLFSDLRDSCSSREGSQV